MTFCFFSAQYLPTPGGVERYTFNLAKRAAEAGHRAIVVTSALPGHPAQERDEHGIEVLRLPVWPMMGGRFPVLRPSPQTAAMTRALWAQKIDFCVVQTRMYTQSVWAAWAARRRGIPTIVIDHSTGYMPMGGGVAGLCGRLYEQAACRLIRAAGPRFYGVSGAVCGWLRRGFGIEAAGVLPNAVDPAALEAEADHPPCTDWRERLALGTDRLVLFVGRLIPEKGAVELARAVAEIPGVQLAVAGTGPQEAELRALGVHVLGALPHPEIARLLYQADVYCLPTRYAEGFPTTLLEAAACGCPIVCSRTAGTDELLPGPGYGILLDDTTPAAIAAGLRRLLDDAALAQRCAAAARQNVLAHFTWDAVFDKILDAAHSEGDFHVQTTDRDPRL